MKKCNCLKEALEEITNKFPEWDGKKVRKFSFSDSCLDFRTLNSFVGIGIDVEYEKQKKLGHTYLTMAFCPLCGKSLKKEVEG